MIVLDASAAVDLVLPREPQATWVESRILAPGESLHAPHLVDVEVASALRSAVLRRLVSARRAHAALRDFLDLRIAHYPHGHFLERAWELRAVLTAADAVYVALAEALEAPLVTTDEALGRTHGHHARIEAFSGGA